MSQNFSYGSNTHTQIQQVTPVVTKPKSKKLNLPSKKKVNKEKQAF